MEAEKPLCWKGVFLQIAPEKRSFIERLESRAEENMKEAFVVTHPMIALQWHPTKNGALRPDQVTAGSGRKVWWLCSENATHEWQARIQHRANGVGCPFCSHRIVTPETSLKSLYSHLVLEWHPTKNGDLTPDDVVSGSHKNVWWQCQKDSTHEWRATVSDRVRGKGCPFCSGHRVTPTTSLKARYPFLAEEWHQERNETLLPEQVKPGSHQVVWWRCKKILCMNGLHLLRIGHKGMAVHFVRINA